MDSNQSRIVLRPPAGSSPKRKGGWEASIEAGGITEEYAESSAAWRAWRCELLAAEREAVLSERDRGEISPEVMRRVLRDLEELRIDG